MNKFDKSTLHSLINVMFEDGTNNTEYIYWSVGDTYPATINKKKITIKIEDYDNQ